MDSVCTHTMMIHRWSAKKIQGGTAKLIAQITEDEANYEKTRVKEEKRREELELFISRFRAQAAKATLVQSKIKMLEKMGVKEALSAEKNLDFVFTAAPFETKRLGEIRELSFGYPGRELLIQNISLVIKPGDRIGVVGRNGKGKSTFLRLVAGELTPANGGVSFHPTSALGYFGQTNIDRLEPGKTVIEEIESANHQLSISAVRTIAGVMMFSGDDGLKKIKVLSGGERSRVFLGKLLAKPTNILLLDEPTNHLDVESIEALVQSLESYNGSIMIVTHSEELLRRLANKLVVFKDDAPILFDGTYDEFIEKGGWGDDDSVKPSSRPVETNTRRDRAEFVQQRSRELKPIEKRVAQLTSRIESLEAKIAEINAGLVVASSERNGAKVTELSTALAKSDKELSSSYTLLETATKELDEKMAYFKRLESEG
jgi:ATP-binding cassette subfamily F protein 3